MAPEDRKRAGLVLDMPIRENVTLADLPGHARMGLINGAAETRTAERQRSRLGIKAPSVETPAVTLSGGNQQKVVLAKWLSMRPQLIVFDEPTRGIDVGAKAEIYDLMRSLAARGVAIIMISSELPEVVGMSDRVVVMRQHRVEATLERPEDISPESIL